MKSTLCAVIILIALPLAGAPRKQMLDLTATFADCGVDIDELLVYRISDIVLIRGTTVDRAKAAEAGRVATMLGYDRVANLIRVVDGPAADALIASRGQRELDLEPMLGGCRFRVSSALGVVQVGGEVNRPDQKSLAIGILLRLPGVKAVSWD